MNEELGLGGKVVVDHVVQHRDVYTTSLKRRHWVSDNDDDDYAMTTETVTTTTMLVMMEMTT